MQFPKFGYYAPKAYGSDVWDPYIMDEVRYELEGLFHKTDADLDNGGYKIVTTIDPVKMKALYAAVQNQEDLMKAQGESLQWYMHVGAVLENPADSSIEALYPGPGFPGSKYNGVGPRISDKECAKIDCKYNMAVYNREQVGSSFKPYILATAVAQGMNVQNSMLDGQDFVCIPPDSDKAAFPVSAGSQAACPTSGSYYYMTNDSAGENGAFGVQDAMTNSVNTAYADLWHYVGGTSVLQMASDAGVDTQLSGLHTMRDEAGVALGQASLTVGEQATFLAALDNGGTYHQIHIVKQVSQGGQQYPLNFTSQPLFNGNPAVNQNMDTQVQYAMQEVVYKGTAAGHGMNDGRQIISKTGTTNTAQSAFFIGAIPQQALAVAIFTDHQSGLVNDPQTLNGLGGVSQGFGGTWPAAIWQTYANNEFSQLQAAQFPQPVFTGTNWTQNLVPKGLIKKKGAKKGGHKNHTGSQPGAQPTPSANCSGAEANTVACPGPQSSASAASSAPPQPNPTDTTGATPNPGLNVPPGVSNSPAGGGSTATQAGAAVGAITVVPAGLLLFRRLERKRSAKRGRAVK
jgi:membrane peptidoglycan carboxypeptidase